MSPQNRLAGRTREELLSHKNHLPCPRGAQFCMYLHKPLCKNVWKRMCNAFWSLDLLWASASVPRPAFLPKAGACSTAHTPSKTGTGETARPNVLLRFGRCASGETAVAACGV